MAIYSFSISEVQRSGGGNSVATSAYISGSKLTYRGRDSVTGDEVERTWDYRNKDGVAYSNILAPLGSEEWVYDREVLWNRAEKADRYKNSNPARKIIGALPVELTLEQNIEFVEDFIREALVSKGMVVDYSLHYDNLKNPHVHMMMTTRQLDKDNATGFAAKKENAWGKFSWIYEARKSWADIQNEYLEMHGFDVRVSHLSHKARGIDLLPGKHEGPARHIKDSRLRATNLKILRENAAAIVANPELVFDKISINKPVFTKEDIAVILSEALAVDMDLSGLGGEEITDLKEVGKSLAAESDYDKNDSKNTDKNEAKESKKAQESNVKDETKDSNSSSIESVNAAFAEKFLTIYSSLLTSSKIELLNPCDLRGRTLYALTKRLDLERRYTASVEELAARENHVLAVTEQEIREHKPKEGIIAYLKEAGRLIEGKINDVTDLNLKYFSKQERRLSEEQLKAVFEIVNGKDLSVLEGFPGAGKTFALKEVVRLYEERGYKVIGTAKSSVAAQVLESQAGIPCMNTTLLRKAFLKSRGDIGAENKFEAFLRTDYFKEDIYSKLCREGKTSPALDSKTVILIDEAGMADAPDMDYLLTEAKALGAKVIMVGDNNQLTAVGITGAFKKAVEIAGSSRLTTVQRHRNENEDIQALQREATRLVGQYKISDAIDIYKKLGYLNIHGSAGETKEALLRNYISDYLKIANALKADNLPAVRSVAIGAYSNEACSSLNITIRSELMKAGILKGTPRTVNNGSNRVIELSVGEQIVFTNNKTLWNGYGGVLNGELGTVLSVSGNTGGSIITALVHKADGSKKVVKLNTADKHPVTVDYGYAITSHKLQGETVDNMKVFFEPSMGYEAFNVLMSRYKYDMQFFAAEDELEKIVWDRTGSDTELLKETYAIKSYHHTKTGEQTLKVPVPNWLIGLNLAACKRANNNFAVDYRAKKHLSTNELAIKEYLEAREAVFGIESKIRMWKEDMTAPMKLSRLFARIQDKKPGLFKASNEINIDPYALIYARKGSDENEAVYRCLSSRDRRELKDLFSTLKEAKLTREETAKVIIEHYGTWVGDKKDRQVSMGDRIIQYNLNYSTIEKHADLSPMRHYLKALKDVKTVAANENYKVIMDVIYNLTVSKSGDRQAAGDLRISARIEEAASKIIKALDLLQNEISLTEAEIITKKEELAAQESTLENLSKEQRDIAAYSNQLFPEFISRVYKASPQEIIKAWNKLVEAQGLEVSLKIVTDNPKVIGSLKGIGLGNFLGLTKERKDALANLNQIPAGFKAYEEGKTKMTEINKEIEEQAYPKVIAELQKTLTAFKNSLPNKYEEAFLLKLSNLKTEDDLNLKSLTELSNHDDVRGLIYEYYNMLNDNRSSKGSAGIVPAEKDAVSDYTKTKEALKDYRYKPQVALKLDFAEVSKQLIETDYRTIFEKYAHLINEDGGTIKERGSELTLGSLTMNVQKGLWKRYSTNEGGNIYSFIEKATNCTKYEALTEVARIAGIAEGKSGEFGLRKSTETEGVKQSTAHAERPEPKNEWAAMERVPDGAEKFNSGIHLAGLLEYNKVGGIYPYFTKEGQLLGYTVRLISKADGSKQVMPVAYCANEHLNKESWRLKGFTDKGYKPIYGIEKLNTVSEATKADQTINKTALKKPVLIVEGEKTADIAQKLFPEYNVLSWLGGSSSAAKANWEILQGRDVAIFPDNDIPGIKSANQIAQCINTSNGYIGFVTIIDPDLLTFQGKTHRNLFPEKWDLGDDLPQNVTVDNIKEAIEVQKERANDLNFKNDFKNTSEQRIYWQSKAAGILMPESQITILAAKEREISAKLSSSEAVHYMNVSEIRGQNECSHELLKYDHPLYQATLTAIAAQESIKTAASGIEAGQDKSEHDLPKLIINLQSSYEKKVYSFLPYKTTEEKEAFEAAKKAVASSHEGGNSKAEMFEVLTKDILMLRHLQLQNLNLEKMPAYLNLHRDTVSQIKEIILSYKSNNGRGTDVNKLQDKDRADIADIAYNKLCQPNYYKDQITKHLEEVSNFRSKLSQVEQFAPNEASILSHMPAKYSLSDSIKAADKRIEEKEEEYNNRRLYAKRAVYDRHSKIFEDIAAFGGKVNKEEVIEALTSVPAHETLSFLNKIRDEALDGYIEPRLKAFNIQKNSAKSTQEVLKIITEEQSLLSELAQNRKDAMQHYGFKNYKLPEAAKVSYEKPRLLENLNKISTDLQKEGFMTDSEIRAVLMKDINIEYAHAALEKSYEDHVIMSSLKLFKAIRDKIKLPDEALELLKKEQSFLSSLHDNLKYKDRDPELLASINKAYDDSKSNIMEDLHKTVSYCLKNKITEPVDLTRQLLESTNLHLTQQELYSICVNNHIKQIDKNLEAIKEGGAVTRHGHKFNTQAHYLEHEINCKQGDFAHDENVKGYLGKYLDHIQKQETVQNLIEHFAGREVLNLTEEFEECHDNHRDQQKQAQRQNTADKTKDDDFSFTM